MQRRRIPTVFVVVLSYVALGVVAAAVAGVLVVGRRDVPTRPKPLVDRSSEIEWIVSATLGARFGSADIRLRRYDPVLEMAAQTSLARANAGKRGWRYEGWFEVKGVDVMIPITVSANDSEVLAELDRFRTIVGEAGGEEAFAQLVAEFGRSMPEGEKFYPVSYAQTFPLAHCNRPRHARIPRLVANRFGEFDPRHVFYQQPPGEIAPTAVFGWNEQNGQWRKLGAESAAAIFNNVDVHEGCDVARESWYLDRLKQPGTKVLEY